jgi:hypothetical protein
MRCALDLDDRALLVDVGQVARNRELWLARRAAPQAAAFRGLVRTVEEMLKKLPAPEPAPAGSERRAQPRQRVSCPVPLRLFSADGRALGAAVADDVSALGIRLLVSSTHAPGDLLFIETGPAESPGPRFAFRVVRCEPLDVGCRVAGPFVAPLPSADTLALLG